MTRETGRYSAPDVGDERTASFTVASWILVSRVTGLLRVVAAGAILGPTFFANIFQATNSVPNLTFNLLAGSVLTSLVVPVLVAALDAHGVERARKLLRHLVGAVLVGFVGASAAVLVVSPVIVRLLTLGVPGAARPAARHEAWILLFLVLPQIACYGIVALACAAQNARGHFALAAAAGAVENIGLIVTLVLVSRIFGTGPSAVSDGYLLFLGIGATLSVAAHAGLQCFGAARVGLALWPSWSSHDPEMRALFRRLVPAIGTSTLDAGWLFILIVAAGTVAGGVVALQVGLNFYVLPVALSARAVGAVLLPRLALEALQARLADFRATYDRGVSWAWFVAVPACVALVLCAQPIAEALAFGRMRRGDGIALLGAAIAGLALALVGATMFEFAKQACYARHNVTAPLVGCAAMVGFALVGAPLSAVFLSGPAMLFGLGVTVALGEITRALVCDRAACRGTSSPRHARTRSLARHFATALATLGPGALVTHAIADASAGPAGAIAGVVVGIGVGLAAYLALQSLLGAPELPPNRLSSRRRRDVSVRDPADPSGV